MALAVEKMRIERTFVANLRHSEVTPDIIGLEHKFVDC